MKNLLLLIAMLLVIPFSQVDAQGRNKSGKAKTVHVKAHVTKKGTYVKEHYRSKPSRKH